MSTKNQTAFDILILPVTFDVDEKLLHKRMIELAAANHPDRFEDPLDQADAAERSATINHAYRQLKDPQSRAQLILGLLAKSCELDEKALPPNLLMEMMEIREEMEEAISSNDTPVLAKLRQWAGDEQTQYLKTLSEQLAKALSGEDDSRAQAVQQAQVSLNCLRYMSRMLEQMPEEAQS